MSIEQSLERIAVALEELVLNEREAGVADMRNSKPLPLGPGSELPSPAPAMPPVEPSMGVNLDAAAVKDAKGLREFAQKYVEKAGEKTQAFVTFIKNDLCVKFAPHDPKLINIPADKVSAAAQAIYAWAFKNKIIL